MVVLRTNYLCTKSKDQSSKIKLTIEHGEIAHAKLVDESIAQRERARGARDVA